MKKMLKKNQKISMVPEDIKGALSTTIKKVLKTSMEVGVSAADMKYYKKDATVEMFTVVDEGMLYFKPTVKEIKKDENVIKVEFNPEKYDLLQRREYTRIDFQKEINLSDENGNYKAMTLDVSAGGMKLLCESEISVSKDYVIEFSLDSNIPIRCYFKPIRIDAVETKSKSKSKTSAKYVVSGKFIALKNIDKIAIVQFCFRKQMESTIK